MRKVNSLVVAWLLFVFAICLFFGLTYVFFKLREEHRYDYEYRVVVNEAVIKKQQNFELPKEKPEEPVLKSETENSEVDLDTLLYERTELGELPRISPDGLRPCDVFAATYSVFPSKKLVHVVILVSSSDADLLPECLEALGKNKVSFVVPAYLNDIENISKMISDSEHEFFIQLPTQSSIPIADKHKVSPILANSNPEDIINKFLKFLASTKKYIGIANISPTLLTKSTKDMEIITEQISARGLYMLDLEPTNDVLTKLSQKNNFYYLNIGEKFDPDLTKAVNKDIVVKLADFSKFLALIKTEGEIFIVPVSEKLKKNETL